MILAFTLSMPNVGSWNGKWTGEGTFYARTRSFRGKAQDAIASKVLEKAYFHHSFGDGWSAAVTVKKVDSKEAAQIKRKTKGFCGYEWMIDDIIRFGRTRTPIEHNIEKHALCPEDSIVNEKGICEKCGYKIRR